MLDFPLMLQVKLPVVDSNRFVARVENKATSDSKLNDHPEPDWVHLR